MKLKNIVIQGVAAPQALEIIHKNHILSRFIGLDQSGRIIMEIRYRDQHLKAIADLEVFLKQCEVFMAELGQVVLTGLAERQKQINAISDWDKSKKSGETTPENQNSDQK